MSAIFDFAPELHFVHACQFTLKAVNSHFTLYPRKTHYTEKSQLSHLHPLFPPLRLQPTLPLNAALR